MIFDVNKILLISFWKKYMKSISRRSSDFSKLLRFFIYMLVSFFSVYLFIKRKLLILDLLDHEIAIVTKEVYLFAKLLTKQLVTFNSFDITNRKTNVYCIPYVYVCIYTHAYLYTMRKRKMKIKKRRKTFQLSRWKKYLHTFGRTISLRNNNFLL